MRAGLLDRRVTFFRRSNTRNEYGEAVQGYTEIGRRFANVRYKTGKEVEASGQIGEMRTTIITVRKDSLTSTVTAADIINFESTQYEIKSITPNYKRDHLEMIVEVM